MHSVRALHPEDVTRLDGIPVTTVPRTLLDIAETAWGKSSLRNALEAAERRDLLDGRALDRLIARSRGRRGLKPLQAAITELTGPPPWTQSQLELQFLTLLRDEGLPEPQANVLVEGYVVDFYWPTARLVVELDGYAFHKSRRVFEADRAKDIKLQLAGCVVLRVTQRRLESDRQTLLSELRAAARADR